MHNQLDSVDERGCHHFEVFVIDVLQKVLFLLFNKPFVLQVRHFLGQLLEPAHLEFVAHADKLQDLDDLENGGWRVGDLIHLQMRVKFLNYTCQFFYKPYVIHFLFLNLIILIFFIEIILFS